MVSTCCISPVPTSCFLKEVRPFGPPGSSPSSLPGELGEHRADGPGKGGWERLPFPLEDTSIFFLWQKLERKTLSLLTLLSNRVCSRFTAYGKEKVTFR